MSTNCAQTAYHCMQEQTKLSAPQAPSVAKAAANSGTKRGRDGPTAAPAPNQKKSTPAKKPRKAPGSSASASGAAAAAEAGRSTPQPKRRGGKTPEAASATPSKGKGKKAGSTAKTPPSSPRGFSGEQSKAVFDALQILTIEHPEGVPKKAIAAALAGGEVQVPPAALSACLEDHERDGMVYVDVDSGLYHSAL